MDNKRIYTILGLLVFCALGFWIVSLLVLNHAIDGFDKLVSLSVQSVRSDMLAQLSNALATVGAPRTEMRVALGVAVVGVTATFLFWRRRFSILAPQFIVFWAATIGAFYGNRWLKHLFHRTRPTDYLASYSYPSGHAMISIAFYMTAAYLLWRNISSKAGRVIVAVMCCLMTLLIGLSRIYLNVHYPSDIISAYFAGGGVVLVMVLLLCLQQGFSHHHLQRSNEKSQV